MTTKTEMVALIQWFADNYYTDPTKDEDKRTSVKIAFGTPGDVINVEGTRLRTGEGLVPDPTTFGTLLDGIAQWLDDSGVGSSLKTKLNDLIAEYNQLRTDYNNGTVPTSASSVSPLP